MSSDDTPDAVLKDRSAAGQKPERPGKPNGGPEQTCAHKGAGEQTRAPKGAGDKTRAPDGAAERKCVLSGIHGDRAGLIRLALGPDGAVWPDLGARLPGRGAWIAPDRTMLETAMAKGKLKGALARAFGGPVTIPEDLPRKIADGLERRALDRLGLELRAGHLIFGSEKLIEWARAGRLHLLLHAGDATENGVQKLNQAWRVGQAALLEEADGEDDAEDDADGGLDEDDADVDDAGDVDGKTARRRPGSGDMTGVYRLPAGREPLSRALGRENIVHSGVTDGKAAARIATDVSRWITYVGIACLGLATTGRDDVKNDGGAEPDRRNDEGRE